VVLKFDEKVKSRNEARKRYGIAEEEKVFVYSGGVSPWQCIEESVELFNKIAMRLNNCKMLLLSGDKTAVEKYASEKIIVDSLQYSAVNSTICAGDFAFLLRKDCVTNNVAYPNKFIEYVQSGMKIIATPYVKDVAEQIDEYNLGVVIEDFNDEPILNLLMNSEGYMLDKNNRQELLNNVNFCNRLLPCVKFLRGE